MKKLYVDINEVVFDGKTYVKDHVLHINKEELLSFIEDFRLVNVDIQIAHPGDSCRLSNVGDIVQPLYKLDGGMTFPGVVDDIGILGTGRTLILRGVVVTEILEMTVPCGMFYDMTGPALEYVDSLADCIHVTIDAQPLEGIEKNDYLSAVFAASKKAAKFLAKAAEDCVPDEKEEFSLDRENLDGLPRVAYVFQIFCHAPLTDSTYYGSDAAMAMPLIIHPNEVLDGGLLCRDYYQTTNAAPTYFYQNHPMMLDLMKRHGKDINFVGVVLANTPHEVADKKRNAMMAASLVKYNLKADGVIITNEGGGHPQIDTALVCDNCSELGVPAVLVLREFLSPTNAADEECIFNTPNADAMVSTGCRVPLLFPKLDKVIGSTPFSDATYARYIDPTNEFYHVTMEVRGAHLQLGVGDYSSEKI
ncbi:MAG: glycine/sarcosine/betaine reductase component B subunit [Dehalobacterium sp.]